jgi:hypothetical protein
MINLARSEDIAAVAGCTHVLGTLRVGDTLLTHLDGLNSIDTVDEMLIVFRNTDLTDTGGLSRVRAVGDTVSIRFNSTLPSIGLKSLTEAGGLDIEYNDVLTSLDDLAALRVIEGDLTINGNPMLSQAEAEAFAAGITVGGTIRVEANGP